MDIDVKKPKEISSLESHDRSEERCYAHRDK
jgi:hypothetical protein